MRRTESIGGRGGPARGFTLVELVTVMGILAILVTLIVSALTGVIRSTADSATRQMLTTLTEALKRYYDDWGLYPWKDASSGSSLMGVVDSTCRPASGKSYDAEAVLYATMNVRMRNGPYMPAGAGQVLEKSGGVGFTYLIYADGWGRPILYAIPSSSATVPLLTSQGPNEFDSSDDITNY